MELRIRSIAYLAEDINGYELVDPNGRDLPRFAAGAHIAVRIPGGAWRDYSLWNDPAERRRYCIAVLRDKEGQGSRRLHDAVRPGDIVEVSWPRNHFPLVEGAERHLLIAGGIGITPIMAMITELKRRRADFRLYYCTRAPEKTAFREELSLLAALGQAVFHYDGGDPARALDLTALLREPQPGTHLYYCGPAGLMKAAAAASAHWADGTVHCEYFTGPGAAPPAALADDTPFTVRLAKSGGSVEVAVGESIAAALTRHGIAVRTSCELGYCAACLTRYLAGEPDHRDEILRPDDRAQYLLACCARSKTPELVLDL
ncbi:MAG TPA: PDR/VanB family oxidoreductase [Stellaceae bacterium]|nr:PDR/VanB family oxidoreductase [Stellaceae bacterium]